MPPDASKEPADWHDLSTKKQRFKTCKRQQIEKHWVCKIQDCIPQSLRPRSSYIGYKPKTGMPSKEAEWWRWSNKFLNSLQRLSELTAEKLAFARELMFVEVKNRQKGTQNLSQVAEMLFSDIDRIITQLMKSNIKIESEAEDGIGSDDNSEANDGEDDFAKEEGDVSGIQEIRGSKRRFDDIKTESAHNEDGGWNATRPEQTGVDELVCEEMPSIKESSMEAQVAKLKANAAELRQEAANREMEAHELRRKAAKREAEAYGLEARMWSSTKT